MIVDDEPLAREFIRDHFPWEQWGCRIAGEAANGREAMELCNRVRPDIMLIDITMPVMDGFELLERVTEQYPHVRCIMLTAHRDFEYARTAIQKGCCGYILKSSPEMNETKHVIDRAVRDIREKSYLSDRHKEQASVLKRYQYPLHQKFFENMMSRIFRNDEEIERFGRTIGIHLQADAYLLLYGEVEEKERHFAAYSEKDRPLIEYSMLEIIRETLQSVHPHGVELFPVSFGAVCLLWKYRARETETDALPSYRAEVRPSYRAEARPSYRSEARAVAALLNEPLSQYVKMRLGFTVSSVFPSLSRLPNHFQQTLQVAPYRFYAKAAEPVFVEDAPAFAPMPPDVQAGLTRSFAEAATGDDEKKLKQWCDQARNALLLYKPSPGDVTRWVASLTQTLPPPDSGQHPPDLELKDRLDALLRSVADWAAAWRGVRRRVRSFRPEIVRALDYIDHRLNEDISVQALADHVQLSPSYLGHLFKQEVGAPIVAHILRQRIEKSKQYLREGQYLNYELAERVGFRSYSYFCNIFKKMTKMTPSEYKQSLWRQGAVIDDRYTEDK